MMGTQAAPERLFYDFCLDDHVPGDHLLHRIDRFLDMAEVRRELRPYYSTIGRPSIDPELMVRMLIVGYCFAIRSERRLCEEVHLNLAYRWFCGLGLDGRVPDHSTFSRNGTRVSRSYIGRAGRLFPDRGDHPRFGCDLSPTGCEVIWTSELTD